LKASDRFFLDGIWCVVDGARLKVANLSLGGFFAATRRPPMKGQVLALALDLPGEPPIPVLGRVTWINDAHKPDARGLPEGFGVKITEIGLAGKLAIVALLKRSAGGSQAHHRNPSP
jgi:Tfp pilus assembly protein PilZ